jgi:hypothetical protein
MRNRTGANNGDRNSPDSEHEKKGQHRRIRAFKGAQPNLGKSGDRRRENHLSLHEESFSRRPVKPGFEKKDWIPAFAGMTNKTLGKYIRQLAGW